MTVSVSVFGGVTPQDSVLQVAMHHLWSWKLPGVSNNMRPPLSSQLSLAYLLSHSSVCVCMVFLSVGLYVFCVLYLSAACVGGFGSSSSDRLMAFILGVRTKFCFPYPVVVQSL